MKKISAALLSASCLALTATAVDAKPSWPNWYIGLHGSLAFVGDENLDGNPGVDGFDQDTGYGYGVSLGYRPRVESGVWSNVRFEVEWHSQESDVNELNLVGGTTVDGIGSVRANTALLNAFYDFETDYPSIRPYLGLGAGMASLKLQNASANFAASNENDTVFAWNAMAGLGYIPTSLPFTEFTVGYRYLSTSEGEFSLVGGGDFELEYDSHGLEAGVKFLF